MTMQTLSQPTVFSPDANSSRQLRDAFGKFATGVTMITAPSVDGPVAIIANSFSSVSLDPALVLWSVDRGARRFPYFEAADHYAIHVLAAEQHDVCKLAARDAHLLNDHAHTLNADGVPLIDHCLARFECRRVAAHDAGDHVIIVGQVQRTEMRDGQPLTFFAGQFGSVD
ncbi:flavin oxidoreductase [Tateyamaria omphalii]|uniref:flavin reductase family protein n=1 Tax=Tateyamaria omphalii TaxID=299262 RepID=UPI00167BF05B|nr:flavin reductase family protein [Tateyamaria omphalii]GGX59123.1 flavin oxidoreductase [Tateyamaria omphalii]